MSNYRRYFQNPDNPVFITFVTYNRRNILIPNINILRNAFKFAKTKFKFDIIAIAILLNHCHMIIAAENPKEISKIIRDIKSHFSSNVPEKFICRELSKSAIQRKEKGIWQRRYYDHIIRNDNDLRKHIDYIHYNPIKHGYVKKAGDWKYSTFKKFVEQKLYDKDWCGFDEEKILKTGNE